MKGGGESRNCPSSGPASARPFAVQYYGRAREVKAHSGVGYQLDTG